ncbi:putative RNA-directed DNA polymerase [Helianthus annuus]|nr:putative RNA-directed DNA polymerase [Helianthus annuus]
MPKILRLNTMSIVTNPNPARENSVSFQCPILTPTNYNTWSIKMEAIMDAHGLWEAIEPPTGVVVDEKKSKQARAFIFQSIPDEVLSQAAKKKTAKEVWDSLKSRYVGAERVQKARLRILKSEFEGLLMKDGETIDEYVGKLSGMVSKYNSVGAKLEDEELVRKLFDTVPERFINLVASIEQSSDVETMSFEEAIAHLKAYEDRVKLRQSHQAAENSLLFSKSEPQSSSKGRGRSQQFINQKSSDRSKADRGGRNGFRGRGRGRGNRGGHAGNQDQRNGSRNKDKRHIECFNCHELGHYASECKQPKKQEQEVHLSREEDEETTLLLSVCDEEDPSMVLLNEEKVFPSRHESRGKDLWYLDNGASNHMTGEREAFAELNENVTGQVRFGDGSKVSIKGQGTLMFQCKNGDQLLIRDAYFIPALTSNILSLGQMTEVGFDVWMHDEYLRVYDNRRRLVMKIQRSSNRLYKISLKIAKPVCLSIHLDDEAWLWHARMGHANFATLESLSRNDLVVGMPRISHPNQICEGCLVAKQVSNPIPKEAQWRASMPLELIHADLCGPITPQTKGGNRYFMLLVDDFTRYMWVYLLETKDQAFQKFKWFKAEAEKEGKCKVKMLRTDRGGEFTSQAFNEFCRNEGIKRQLTAPYTPQQNGVVERRNRTVVEMTRSFLKSMSVPEALWGEAVRHSVYILNRITTKAVKNATPYELWKGHKPNLERLKVFGCVGYVRQAKKHFGKLDDRGEAMVYLGSEDETKGYRMYDPNRSKIVTARTVECIEDKKWVWCESTIEKPMSSWSNLQVNGPSVSGHIQTQTGDDGRSPKSQTNNVFQSPASHVSGIRNKETQGSDAILESLTPASNSVPFDETPVQGFRSIGSVYQDTTAMNEEEVHELYEKEAELFLIDDEPVSYEEAATKKEWIDAMKTELDSINRNKTWTLTRLPRGHRAVGLKWVFKIKRDADGAVTKHKARVVAKGYVQRKGVDFEEAFAPVARLETIRLLLAIAANENWLVHHLDVKSAFLNGNLKEEVYVTQPSGFEVKGKEDMVYRLHKALYGLRQAPRAWNAKLDEVLKDLGFNRCVHEQAVYKVHDPNFILIVGVYVDDLIVTGSNEVKILEFKKRMKTIFDMTDMGKLSYYLGIEVEQTKMGILLKQESYAKKILEVAGMATCNPTKFPMTPKKKVTKDEDGEDVDPTLYRKIIGSLRYLIHTRPDLSYSVGAMSRFMQSPKQSHFAAVKQILRYVRGTVGYGLKYSGGGDGKLTGYSDSSFSTDDGRGTTGMAFYYSNNLITWCSQKQKTVALSSCEAEFMAATSAACQALWLRNMISELIGREAQKVKLLVDNESAIALMKNPVFHGRSKHIDTKHHFIRECVERGQIFVEHVSGNLQKADILTKPLNRVKFAEMRSLAGIVDLQEVNTKGESVRLVLTKTLG